MCVEKSKGWRRGLGKQFVDESTHYFMQWVIEPFVGKQWPVSKTSEIQVSYVLMCIEIT